MKKILSRMLALALCLGMLAASAMAEDGVIPVLDENYIIHDTETVGDTAYILTSLRIDGQLWRWTENMQQAELVAGGLVMTNYWDSMDILRQAKANAEGEAEQDLTHAISVIFTDGEKLYGFNQLNSLVFTIEVTDEGLAYEDVATLPYTDPIYASTSANRMYVNPTEVLKTGDWMLWFAADQSTRYYEDRLLAFNLKTGAVKQAVLPHPREVTVYKDGKVLALCDADGTQRDVASALLYTYDPQTDMTEQIGVTPPGIGIRRIAYSRALDMLVYQHNTRIMGWTEGDRVEQLGFIPVSAFVRMDVVGNKVLYTPDDTNLAVTTLHKGYKAEHSLNILGGNVDRVIGDFRSKYKDIPYYYLNEEDGMTCAAMFARENEAPDIVLVNADEFTDLMKDGLLLDLSGYAEVKAYTDSLYPVYRDFVSRDGGVYGVPVSAGTYDGWFINKKVMQDMGLTAEEIPTSLTELCDFATRWNNEYAETYPHYTLLNETTEYRQRIFGAMLAGWRDYCQFAGKELTLDDPVFRELLTALDGAQLDKLNENLKQTNPEVSEYKQALIWTGVKDVGNWACYMEDFSDRIFLPITLTPETPYTAAVDNFYLWVVNERTDNAEYAAALIAEYAENINNTYAYVLRSDRTEPVKNDYHTETIANAKNELAALENSLEASVNRATVEKRIESQRSYIENELARQEYSIFASAVANYVEVILPGAFVALPDELGDGERELEITGIFNRYLSGALKADEMIEKAEMLLK